MPSRYLISIGFFITILSASLHVEAARVELMDGSIIVGEIAKRSSQLYSIRMTNGAMFDVRSCDIVRVLGDDNGLAFDPSPPPALRFSGSNTLGEKLIPELVKAFVETAGAQQNHWSSSQENERILEVDDARGCTPKEITIKAHGSSTAFRDLALDEAEVGMSSRPIKPEEIAKLADSGDLMDPDAEHVLALDGVVIVMHPDNPVHSLTTEAISRIFAGDITDWSDVGGNPGPIAIFSRDENSGTYDTFNALVLKPHGRALASTAKRFESSARLSDTVSSERNAIGFIGLAYIRDAKPLALNECDLIYDAKSFNVKTEEYPLARRLFLYQKTAHPDPLTQNFIGYALSDPGQHVIRKSGFIDLGIETNTEVSQEGAQLSRLKAALGNTQNIQVLRGYMDTTEGATRLSVTFRFKWGSSSLDNRALRDIKRLAAYMKSGGGKGKQLLILGFADNRGEYKINLSLSRTRARSVARQLAWSGVRGILTEGFGEEVPAGCNNTKAGFDKNRRVEAWIK